MAVLSACVCAGVCGARADDVPGFLPETVVIAPGNGVATDTGSACDLVKVTGDLVTEGPVTVDLGRDASNPLAKTFEAKVAEIDGAVTLGGPLGGAGCGIPGHTLSVRREGNGIWVKVVSGGSMLIFR